MTQLSCARMRTPILACFFAFAIALHAADDKPKFGVHKPLGEQYTANNLVAPEQSRLVIYRAPSQELAGVVTVYLADRYHVSLQANAFSSVCLETHKVDIRTRLTQPEIEPEAEQDTRYAIGLKKGLTQFVRVTQQSDGRTRLQEVPARIAQDELKTSRQQMHTRSRVTNASVCKEVKEAVLAFDPNVITFGTDATFEYKRTDIHSLSASGKQALRQVIDKLNSKYADATAVNIRVIGYADDAPDDASNERTALARAQTIKSYFVSHGLRSTELSEEGRCSKSDEKAAAFNLSKRRVEIEVSVSTP